MDPERVPTGADALDDMIQGGFPEGSLIIVAGNPGAGKTAFATGFICKGIRLNETAVYASIGQPMETFVRDASRHLGPDAQTCMSDTRMNFLDLSAVREGGAPTMIRSILEHIERVGAKRLVIDSFSAMALTFEKKLDARNILQAILGKVVRELKCTTILVVEVPFGEERVGTGVEEFAADGLIKLGSEMLEDRLVRSLELAKLRGTRIAERKLVFTLEGGFRVIPPFRARPVDKPQRYKPLPEKPDKFSTGSEELDQILGGGYPVGSTILMEIDNGVADSQAQLILAQTVRNFMAKGRAGIMIPSTGVDTRLMKLSAMRIGLTEDEVNRYLRICLLHFCGTHVDPFVVPLKGDDMIRDGKRIVELEEELMKATGQPIVTVGGYDSGIASYGMEAMMKTVVIDAARARDKGNLNIVVLRPGYGAASTIMGEMANIHLKLTEKFGALLLYGVKPRTGLHAIEMDTSKGYATPTFVPIV